MKEWLIGILLIVGFVVYSNAQPVSAYGDYQNQFFAWDNGMIRKIDYLLPIQYKIGRNAIPYLDNARNFKIYSGGATTQINNGNTNAFYPTDNLVVFANNTILQVWEDGIVTKLSNLCNSYKIGDSLVLFFDRIQSETKIYYNKEIYSLETFYAGFSTDNMFEVSEENTRSVLDNQDVANGQIPAVQVSDNVAAYLNYANQFKIFYQGKLMEQELSVIKNFAVGRNTVAYVDANSEFQVFFRGATQSLDNYQPYNYQVGDNLVAYIGSDNYFKIFYEDSIYNIGYFQPDFVVKDNIVYYQDMSGYFHVFYKGKDYPLETYYPDGIVAGYNSVAYISRNRMIKIFTEARTYDVINSDISFWRLDYDVIQYRFGTNLNKVFYKGKTY